MGFSKAARTSAATAKKIRSRLGEAAYLQFKKDGKVPAGLDQIKPKSKQKSNAKPASKRKSTDEASKLAADSREILARAQDAPSFTGKDGELYTESPVDKALAGVAAALPTLSDEDFLKVMSAKPNKPNSSKLQKLAQVQATTGLTDESLVDHFKDTGVFVRRGMSAEQVKEMRTR